MPRKDIVRIVLSRRLREMTRQIAARLGQSESETMRTAFVDYAKGVSLATEKVHANRDRADRGRAFSYVPHINSGVESSIDFSS